MQMWSSCPFPTPEGNANTAALARTAWILLFKLLFKHPGKFFQ